MIYADTEFFLALLKGLKSPAQKLLDQHQGQLVTSGITLIELLLVSKEYELDPERLIIDALEIAQIEDAQPNLFLVAASYLKEHPIGVFDALYAASCGDRTIVSSDKVFDKLGLRRLSLAP